GEKLQVFRRNLKKIHSHEKLTHNPLSPREIIPATRGRGHRPAGVRRKSGADTVRRLRPKRLTRPALGPAIRRARIVGWAGSVRLVPVGADADIDQQWH